MKIFVKSVMWFDLIQKEFIPFPGVDYFIDYYEIRRQIKMKSRKMLYNFNIIFGLFAFQSCYFLYQYFRTFNPIESIVHGDIMRVCHIIPEGIYLFFYIYF